MTLSKHRWLPSARRGPRTSPIGIEVDGPCVRAAQLARGRAGDYRLLASTEFCLPTSQVDADGMPTVEGCMALRNVLRRRGFEGDRVALAAPVRLLGSDLLELPDARAAGDSDASAHVRSLLSRAARCAPAELEVAYWPRRAEGEAPSAYAVAVRHADAMRLVSSFEEAGLDAVSLGCAASSTGVLLEGLGLSGDCSAVLRLGFESHLVLLCRGRQVIYQRTLDAGGFSAVVEAREVTAPASPPLNLPLRTHLSSVAAEVASTLECVPRTFPKLGVARLLVSGVAASSGGVADHLAESLGDLALVDPTVAVSRPETQPGDPSLVASSGVDVALGLALAEVTR